jgi:site-specific recombinase XerD
MSGEKRVFKYIGSLTEEFLRLKGLDADKKDASLTRNKLEDAFAYLRMTDSEFVDSYKKASDKTEWQREVSRKIQTYYNELKKTKAINTARSYVTPIRSFSSSYCVMLKVETDKPQRAHGQHIFTQNDIAKIFSVADPKEKAIIAFGVATAFNAEQLIEMKRKEIEPIVNRAISENADFTGYEYTRSKTKEEGYCILSKHTVTVLKEWLDYGDNWRKEHGYEPSEWLFWSNGDHISENGLEFVLKELVKKANIVVSGSVSWHLIRKYVFTQLLKSGFNAFEAKHYLGKALETSDSTYIQSLHETMFQKFKDSAYDNLKLLINGNGTRIKIEELEERIKTLEERNKTLTLQNEVLVSMIPKKQLAKAIKDLAKKYNVDERIFTGRDFFKTPLTFEELTKAISQKKAESVKE